MRHRPLSRAMPAFVLLAALAGPALAQEGRTYQQPPAQIADILDTRPTPTPSLSPDRTTLALFDRASLPPIAELWPTTPSAPAASPRWANSSPT